MKNGNSRISFRYKEEHEEIQKYFSNPVLFEGHQIRIISKLGEGRHSKTFHAEMDGRRVTIKVDERELFQDEDEIREKIQALKSLRHNRIGQVLDFIRDTENNRSYVIMEFVNGTGLDLALEEKVGGCFQQSMALNWGCQILDALSYLHSNFIHGDVKLSNIVRRRDDSICLSDFSYLVDDPDFEELDMNTNNPDEINFQEITDFFGTPRDSVIFQRMVRKDIYRVGDVLFQLLTGEKAIKGESEEKKRKRLTDMGVFGGVADIVVKALSEDPEDRWQSADEMRNALLELPRRDTRRRSHIVHQISRYLIVGLLLLFAIGLYRAGIYKIQRAKDMEDAKSAALSAWDRGDYTEAFRNIFDSLKIKKRALEPDCTPDMFTAAAEILGVYDYTDGYRPFYSISAFGEPLCVGVSPGETRFAILTEEASGLNSSSRFLHVINAEDGKELPVNLEVNGAASPDVAFLDEQTALYISRTGALSVYSLNKNVLIDEVGKNALRFVLSGDKTVAAFIGGGEDELVVYVCQITQDFHFSQPRNITLTGDIDAENCLFALNQDGSCLAVSLERPDQNGQVSRGVLAVYPFPEPGNPDNSSPLEEYMDHAYERCQGGFCGDYLSYAAGDNLSEFGLYRLVRDKENASFNLDFLGKQRKFARSYASADENGIYFAYDNNIEYPTYQTEGSQPAPVWQYPVASKTIVTWWTASAPHNGNIITLSHSGERVLVMTDSNRIDVCQKGATNTVSEDVSFLCAAISEKYLVLCNSSVTAVQKWENGSQKALSRIKYEENYAHRLFNVTADKTSAMLYGGEDLFRIYDADGNLRASGSEKQAKGAENWKYLREPELKSEPNEECLRVTYEDKTAYYAATDGEPLLETEGTGITDILTKDYRLIYRPSGGTVEIYKRDGSELLKSQPVDGILADAFQSEEKPGILLISLLSRDNDSQSRIYNRPSVLLLNKDLEVIAELSGAYMILADGALYCDDGESALLEGKIYDREDLAEIADRAVNAQTERAEDS